MLCWAAAGALALAGCSPAAPEPSPTPTATAAPAPSATASATPSVTPSATPETTPEAASLTACDQLLTAEEEASLDADGLALQPASTAFDFDYPIVEEIASGGLLCRWTGQGDVSVVIGQLAVADDQWPDRRDGLLAEGYVADDGSYPGFVNGPDGVDDDYPGRGVVHADGILYYVSYPGILASIVPLQD